MKKLSLILAALIVSTVNVQAQVQQSDSRLLDSYSEEYHSIRLGISNALTINKLDSLNNLISNLELDYSKHGHLIEFYRYPSSLRADIRNLKELLRSAEHRLLLIENQHEQISSLNNQLIRYTEELRVLRTKSEKLSIALSESEKSELKLSQRVQLYRKQIEQRDRLLFSMIDTLMRDYEQVLNQGMIDSESAKSGLIQQNNILLAISNIAEHRATEEWPEYSLTASDYFRMYMLADQVDSFVQKNGQKMSNLYTGSSNDNLSNTQIHIETWKNRIENQLWASVSSFMQAKGLQVQDFEGKDDFIRSFQAFINNELTSRGSNPFSQESYDDYAIAEAFWSEYVMEAWGNDAIQADLLTFEDYNKINASFNTWQEESKPWSTNLFLLLGFGGTLIMGLVYTVYKLY